MAAMVRRTCQPCSEVESYTHDLNNFLTIILARSAGLLKEDLSDPGRVHLEEVLDAVRRAVALVERARAGIRSPRQLDLNLFVRSRARLLQALLTEGTILEVDCDPGIPLVSADPLEVDRILMNLVKNAGEAVGIAGRVRVVARSTRTGDGVDHVCLAVEDDGAGMSEVARRRLLEEEGFTSKPGGSGLGLGNVRRLVSDHGAELAVTSETGGGTRVEVRFRAL